MASRFSTDPSRSHRACRSTSKGGSPTINKWYLADLDRLRRQRGEALARPGHDVVGLRENRDPCATRTVQVQCERLDEADGGRERLDAVFVFFPTTTIASRLVTTAETSPKDSQGFPVGLSPPAASRSTTMPSARSRSETLVPARFRAVRHSSCRSRDASPATSVGQRARHIGSGRRPADHLWSHGVPGPEKRQRDRATSRQSAGQAEIHRISRHTCQKSGELVRRQDSDDLHPASRYLA